MRYVVVIDLDSREKGLVINALKILDAPEKKRMFPKIFGEAR